MQIKNCQQCNKQITISSQRQKHKKFCSPKCRNNYYRINNRTQYNKTKKEYLRIKRKLENKNKQKLINTIKQLKLKNKLLTNKILELQQNKIKILPPSLLGGRGRPKKKPAEADKRHGVS